MNSRVLGDFACEPAKYWESHLMAERACSSIEPTFQGTATGFRSSLAPHWCTIICGITCPYRSGKCLVFPGLPWGLSPGDVPSISQASILFGQVPKSSSCYINHPPVATSKKTKKTRPQQQQTFAFGQVGFGPELLACHKLLTKRPFSPHTPKQFVKCHHRLTHAPTHTHKLTSIDTQIHTARTPAHGVQFKTILKANSWTRA